MILKDSYPPGTEFIPIQYKFLEPVRVTIEDSAGYIQFVNYGIGDMISVMSPRVIYLVAVHENLERIPLEDGRFIVEFPESARLEKQW